jgi:hypothetical protein
MGISEASTSDQLSEILTHDQNLNEKFIDVVEKIHMKQRMMEKADIQKIDILIHK